MIKRASAALLTTMAICALATSADCQSFGTWNPALTYHTVDASALGTDGRGFIEYSTSDDLGRTLAGGVGLWGGVQLTARRLSMELGLRDLPRRQFGNTEYKLGAGLRWRF